MPSYVPRHGDRPLMIYRQDTFNSRERRERRQIAVDIRRWLYNTNRHSGIDYDDGMFHERDIFSPWSHFTGQIRITTRFCREWYANQGPANQQPAVPHPAIPPPAIPSPANPPPVSASDPATLQHEASSTADLPQTDALPSVDSPVSLKPALPSTSPSPPMTSVKPSSAPHKGTSEDDPIAIDDAEDDAAVIALANAEAFERMGG